MTWDDLAATLALTPADAQALGLAGARLAQAGALDLALARFDRARRASPDDPRGHFAYGGVLQALGYTELAEAAFTGAALCRPPIDVPKPELPLIGLGWKPGLTSGWEVYGYNFLKRIAERGDRQAIVVDPVIAAQITNGPFHALYEQSRAVMVPYLAQGRSYEFPVLVALGNDFGRFPHIGRSAREFGIMFIEYTNISVEGRQDAARYERIIAGSTWCGEIVRGMGFDNVDVVIQGIDPSVFNPDQRPARSGPFRVFSGGKLEFRKGQDLVVEAFKRFHARRPDSVLVTCWHSSVPMAAANLPWGGIVGHPPEIGPDGRMRVKDWLMAQGLPDSAIEDTGVVPNTQMPSIFSTVHAAVFTNRCEGGTNLPAMEAMAAGVPTILSANTGHLDLIEPDNCIPLTRQYPVLVDDIPGTEGWGTSDIDEVVEALDTLYIDHQRAEEMGALGAQTLHRLTWSRQIDQLLAVIDTKR